MKNWILQLALALSLLFNVFFAVGYVKARNESALTADAEQTANVNRIATELALDDEQKKVYASLRKEMRSETEDFGRAMAVIRRSIVDALGEDAPDLSHIRERVSELTALHRERHEARSAHFEQFLGVLSDEQIRNMARRLSREERERRFHAELLEKFDADGDGTLSEAERSSAEAFVAETRTKHQKMREQWQAKRRELEQQADANGDGKLDPAERETLHKLMRENGWRGPRGEGRNGRRGSRGHRNGERHQGPPPPPPGA